MAEGFATALDQIAFELSHAKGLHALYNTPEMTTAVINLYSHVLKFLCASMKWCMDQGPFGKIHHLLFLALLWVISASIIFAADMN
jgi:hypothetical protein